MALKVTGEPSWPFVGTFTRLIVIGVSFTSTTDWAEATWPPSPSVTTIVILYGPAATG